ncbi:hypothetical protein LUZ60_001897 [Juncus effusus]|nr:hypothetical protein LUZ60_001897 [Juncus effusus]
MMQYEIFRRSENFLLFVAAVSLQFISGQGDDGGNSTKTETPSGGKGKTGETVLIVLLVIGASLALGFGLFKYWQRKKREEQHARLLKLFEEDDELEVELGLRD